MKARKEVIIVRLSSDEKKELEEKAISSDMTISDFVRSIIKNTYIVKKEVLR